MDQHGPGENQVRKDIVIGRNVILKKKKVVFSHSSLYFIKYTFSEHIYCVE